MKFKPKLMVLSMIKKFKTFLINKLFIYSSENKYYKLCKILLKYQEINNKSLLFAIHNANLDNELDLLEKIMNNDKIKSSRYIDSLLMNSIINNKFKAIKLLLNHPKVRPNTQNNLAFYYAVKYSNLNVINLLLNNPKVTPEDNIHIFLLKAFEDNNLELLGLLWKDKRIQKSTALNMPTLYKKLTNQFLHLKINGF
jgi:hypothetical protein